MPKSTRLSLFPDVNVWVALTYEGHVHQVAARAWFESLVPSARLFFCRITQPGFLRLLTSEAVMGRDVLSQLEAWTAYDRWLRDDRVSFLAEPEGLEDTFRAMSRLPHPAPKDWADSYLAAFASAANLTLVTFDRALQGKAKLSAILTP